jgi:hypothetical protein
MRCHSLFTMIFPDRYYFNHNEMQVMLPDSGINFEATRSTIGRLNDLFGKRVAFDKDGDMYVWVEDEQDLVEIKLKIC